MKKNMKRIFMTICLAVLMLATFGLCMVGCNKSGELKIVFKEQPYAYSRNDTADAYDLIVREKDVEYSFAFSYLTVSDSGETVSSKTQNIAGNTIFLTEASRYTLYVTAKKGEASASGSTTFDVYGDSPVLLPVSLSQVYKLGYSSRISVLLDKAAPTVLPAGCEVIVDYYTYQENQAPSISSSGNTNPKIKIDVNYNNPMESVVFDKLGLYEFHMVAENDGKMAEATFKVKILPDQSTPVEGISAYKNAEFGANADGSIDSSVVRLVGQPELDKASYAVLDENFVAGQVARFEFYGKNMPYLGIFNQDFENAVDGNSITTGGLGYVFTMERRGALTRSRVYGYTRMAEGTASLRSSVDTVPLENFGWNHLEEGKHYFFEMAVKKTGTLTPKKQKNKSFGCGGLTWLEEKLWGTAAPDAATGNVNCQDLALYFSLYEVDESGKATIVAHSMAERFEKSLGGTFFLEGEEVKGKLVAYSSISKDVTFKYYKDTLLNNDNFDSSRIFYDEETQKLSWDPVEGAVNYVITTSDVSSERFAVLNADTTEIDVSERLELLDYFSALDVNVYASVGNNTFSECKYECRIKKNPEGMDSVYMSGSVTDYDAENNMLSVSLAGGYANSAAHFQNEVDYVAFDEEFVLNENGTYVDVYFTGNNMPQVEFFASDILGNIQNVSGSNDTGFIVTNGHARNHAYEETSMGGYGYYSNYALFYKYGVTTYERLTNGNVLNGATYANVDGTYTYKTLVDGVEAGEEKSHNYSNFSMYSLMKTQDPTQDYRYTVGMFKDPTGGVWIDSKLFKINNGVEETEPFASWKSSVVIKAAVKEVKDDAGNVVTEAVPAQTVLNAGQTISGKIVLHAGFKGIESISGENFYTKFSLTNPYVGSAASAPLVNGGTLDAETGVITLEGGAYYSASSYTKEAGYIAFRNAYNANPEDTMFTLDENGTYVEFYFTGNNMPNVEFFASSISGSIWKDDVNKGYVVTNGNASRNTYNQYRQIMEKGLMNGDLAAAYENGVIDFNVSNTNGYKYNGLVGYTDYFKYGVSSYDKYSQGKLLVSNGEIPLAYSLRADDGSWTKDRTLNYSKFSMYSLMANENQEWKYVVGMYLDGKDVCLDAKLYKVDGTTETEFAAYNTVVETLEEGVVRSGYIVAHAALKGATNFVGEYNKNSFKYTAPYAGNASTRV